MTDDEFSELIEQSSLGSPGASALRARTSPEVARAIVAGSRYYGRAVQAEAENARLRAVVAELHEYVAIEGSPARPDVLGAMKAAWGRVHDALAALDALDVSGDMGGSPRDVSSLSVDAGDVLACPDESEEP